jgi:hypothetical protein
MDYHVTPLGALRNIAGHPPRRARWLVGRVAMETVSAIMRTAVWTIPFEPMPVWVLLNSIRPTERPSQMSSRTVFTTELLHAFHNVILCFFITGTSGSGMLVFLVAMRPPVVLGIKTSGWCIEFLLQELLHDPLR